jgi:hypothetical protein
VPGRSLVKQTTSKRNRTSDNPIETEPRSDRHGPAILGSGLLGYTLVLPPFLVEKGERVHPRPVIGFAHVAAKAVQDPGELYLVFPVDLVELLQRRLLAVLLRVRRPELLPVVSGPSGNPLRDARYFAAIVRAAQVIADPASTDTVAFGSTVTFRRDDGRAQKYRIVGEDEADPKAGSISFVSPVMGKAVGGCSRCIRSRA